MTDVKSGTYIAYGPDGVPRIFIVVRPDGTYESFPVSLSEPAQCTVCRRGAGNDCPHFVAR